MEPGNIVEFIDRQKIMCAVVLDVKNLKLRLLTENNRELNISVGRLSHKGDNRLNLSAGRVKLVDALKRTAARRKQLIDDIDIKELWDVLNTEQEWIDLSTMTHFCFPDNPTFDHESAVIRAFFSDKRYFKFNSDRFFPNTRHQVDKTKALAQAAERKNRIIEAGATWFQGVMDETIHSVSESHAALIEVLKSYYLFGKESSHWEIARAILDKTGHKNENTLFQALVRLGVWDKDENIELLRQEVPDIFSKRVLSAAAEAIESRQSISGKTQRKDLRSLPLMTIDGQATLDFDDAISIQEEDNYFIIGVHIADVGHYIEKNDIIDREARKRASSIYMPDKKISMLPPGLAEDLCSLKVGEDRPAISIMARLRRDADVIGYEIFPSIIQIQHQMTYYDVNMVADEDPTIKCLYDIAKNFQQNRLNKGAVQISLPEVNMWIEEDGNPNVTKTNRESPGRLLVAELMIMANWLMARYLADKGMPAIYRAQPGPRDRLYKNNEGTIFQNWVQRKLLSRFYLSTEPEPHSGLGLDAYVTASSPIRKYFDLATQRQLRATFGLEAPYSRDEIQRIISGLEQPMGTVGRLQFRRNRYWLLKYLEGRVGRKEEAIVIMKRRNSYIVLLTGYMIESALPLSMGIDLKPETLVQVTIQHVNARKDVLTVYLG
jgi:exoribonuclease II